MRYRRALVEGATYFFTVNLADRGSRLLVEQVDALREAVRVVKRSHPFEIVAWVVLSDHIHAVWTLPTNDADYSARWNQIKGGFSRRIGPGEEISNSRAKKQERSIWQRRFWEHLIRDDLDLKQHVDYVHYNPVKHGHSSHVADWPFSSFHLYCRRGWLATDWACDQDWMEDCGESR
ncbi:REP-associated tyrosine transposase [Thiorhodococcus minor]|uniref:Transposase n=1 Tax=Thiorhodococcus minor TaxID=57489 RepID=A0A6M0K0H9_9GAMM|nr:transposase [Thiorhodococcus minor]NEV63250.1 transposase [Thiorhodococcus minor]